MYKDITVQTLLVFQSGCTILDKQIQGIRSDRGPEELWMEVRDIVQETGIKTIPKKKKGKKAKWLSEEALQIAVKRREVKSKGEKERTPIECRI